MRRHVVGACAAVAGFVLATQGCTTGGQRDTVVVAVPAKAGPVEGLPQNSDAFIWQQFAQFVAPVSKGKPSPVVFETWASDADTFSTTPQWPSPEAPKKFQASVLRAMATPGHSAIDVPCNTPGNAAVGGFPTSGTPTPCIAEEVKRNRPQFDYIVSNNLNTQTGLAAAYAKALKVTMPTESISVKGDWIPVQTLLQWIPTLGSIDNIHKLYYTNTSDSVEYALVSLHVSSRQNPNWVWGTFEHQMNPGRCDSMGCFDSFGAVVPAVRPNQAAVNTQYGACEKTPQLKALMAEAGAVAGLGELLPEVHPGGLQRRRWDALRAGQLGHRAHRRQRHRRRLLVHRVPRLRLVRRGRQDDRGRHGDAALQPHGPAHPRGARRLAAVRLHVGRTAGTQVSRPIP